MFNADTEDTRAGNYDARLQSGCGGGQPILKCVCTSSRGFDYLHVRDLDRLVEDCLMVEAAN
jgi:hypothetical protein